VMSNNIFTFTAIGRDNVLTFDSCFFVCLSVSPSAFEQNDSKTHLWIFIRFWE